MEKISGQKHEIIRMLDDLQKESGRKRHGAYFVENPELVSRAFDYGAEVMSVIMAKRYAATTEANRLAEMLTQRNIPLFLATSGLIGKVLKAKPVPDCIAIVKRKLASLPDLFRAPDGLVVGVEHGENADNLGMLLRSADAAGVNGAVLTDRTVEPFNRRTIRGSRGGVFSIGISIKKKMSEAIETAKNAGYRVIAGTAHAEMVHFQCNMTPPCFVIVGNEHMGVSPEVLEIADEQARIPMFGQIQSLNIAVAASLMLHEARRQQSFSGETSGERR